LHYAKRNLSQKDITQPTNQQSHTHITQPINSSIPFWHTFPLYSFIVHYLVSPSIYIKKLVHMILWCSVESILPPFTQKYKSRAMPITFCSHQKLALKGTYTFWKASCLSSFQHLSQARERFIPLVHPLSAASIPGQPCCRILISHILCIWSILFLRMDYQNPSWILGTPDSPRTEVSTLNH